jgi:uncharacterized repeat protein (TIGR01451 family)
MTFLEIIARIELPRWWRLGVIAVGAIILCSCKSMTPVGHVSGRTSSEGEIAQSNQLPQRSASVPRPMETFGHPLGGVVRRAPNASVQPVDYEIPSPALPPAAYDNGAVTCEGPGYSPVPYGYGQACAPCAQPCPHVPRIPSDEWIVEERPCDASNRCPPDEYICDGGDQEKPVRVAPDYRIVGLDVEDTVAHFDTLDGRRLVEQSNKLCIYSPRFASVRQVRGIRQHEGRDFVGRIHQPEAAHLSEEAQLAFQYEQPVQPVGQIGTKQPTIFRDRNAGVGMDASQSLIGLASREQLLGPVEVLSSGLLEQADKPRLAAAIDSAIVWSHDLGVIVQISGQRLAVDTHDTKLGEIVMVDHEGNPGMRIIKIASHKEAQSGDVVEFTLRFDNIGDEEVGNVTIVDNLTTRLEYVEDSQSCTPDATFLVEPNEGQSLALRWEILEPIPPGQGGVIKFKCRVR